MALAPRTPDGSGWGGASFGSAFFCQNRPDEALGLDGDMMRDCSITERRRRGSYSLLTAVMRRECVGHRLQAPRHLLQDLNSPSEHTHAIESSSDTGSPPFSLEFGQSRYAGKVVVSDEEGYIHLINTDIPKREDGSHRYSWMCHRNAIFDVAFSEGDDMLATASGDQTIRVWDMRPQQPEAVATLRGHKGSVKAVEFRPHSRNQLVSGARGGDVILWDTRTSSGQAMSVLNVKPLQQIANAHVRDWPRSGSAVAGGRGSSASKGAMGGASRGKKSTQGPPSVTSVVFIDEYVLASAGANDGAVKLWDLRKAWNSEGKSTPCRSFMTREASATGRARGITALAVSHTSSKLLASSADHHIYMFDCIVPEREAVMFSGHVNSSFYVKSTFSPDARFILSGSTDNHVYIWDVANPLIPPLRLKGHSGEVSDVAWSPTDFWKLASSSDDTTVRVWTVDRALNDHQRQHAHAFRDETETGRAANTFADVGEQILYDGFAASRVAARPAPFSTGAAEVPRCWSQPLVQSEEDRLTCQETMMFSDMLLSPAEGGAWGESGEHAPIWCEDRRSMTRRLSAQLDASQAASQPEVASHTGLSGSPMGLPSRRSPSGSPWMPGVMEGEVNGGAGSGGAAATTPTTVSRAVRVRSMRSPSLKQPRLTDYFKQHDGTSSPRADSPLLSPRRLSPVDATGSGGGGASGEGSSCLESDAVLAAARPDSGERERAAEQGNGGMGGGDEGVVTPHTAVKRARHTAHIS